LGEGQKPESASGQARGRGGLGADAFATELTSRTIDRRAVVLEMLIQDQAQMRAFEQLSQQIFSPLDRLTPQVLAIQLEQIERAKDRTRVRTATADQFKDGKSVDVANNGLAID
jgi:hypothetical protein